MNTDFDFDNIGKRTPYRTPEGFFDEMQRNVMQRTCGEQRRKRRRLAMIISTTVAMAAIFAGLLFVPSFYQHPDEIVSPRETVLTIKKNSNIKTAALEQTSADKWIKELSDEELEELVNFSENDLFLN